MEIVVTFLIKLIKIWRCIILSKKTGSDLIVESLKNHDVQYVFGIPGAKIDAVFNSLKDGGPELIVTRHEQNAVFIAQAIGRMTGKPGVVVATSGPGASNMVTGLATARADGDPVLAFAGQVQRSDLKKLTHQSMDNIGLFTPITKYSAEVQNPETLSEAIANAYRIARADKMGATAISVPQDITGCEVESKALYPSNDPEAGPAAEGDIRYLAEAISKAKLPVLLVGMRGSGEKEALAIRKLVQDTSLPIVETFQAAGTLSRELEHSFFGRVGLFRNQPGDMLLRRSDLVIVVGYDPIEYEARNWNAEKDTRIIAVDKIPAEVDHYLQPEKELVGNIAGTLSRLRQIIQPYRLSVESIDCLKSLKRKLDSSDIARQTKSKRLHPLEVIKVLQENVSDEMTVTVDIGSHYIWMARHFKCYEPRHLLFSNGMQTLGVALPWAIGAALVRPKTQILSISGDGGFLFSAQELETAVRRKMNIVQLIWNDGHYNMVEFQEQMKYGRSFGVNFGPVDFVKYAEAFGAKGLRVRNAEELIAALQEGFATAGPVLIDIPINYADNKSLGESISLEQFD